MFLVGKWLKIMFGKTFQIFSDLKGIMPHSFRTKFETSDHSDIIQAGYKERTEI